MKVRIRGLTWKLVFTRLPPDRDGDCDDPSEPRRRIRIRRSLRGLRRLEVLLHEIGHASCWDLSEEFVHDWAKDAAQVLWAAGYRAIEESD